MNPYLYIPLAMLQKLSESLSFRGVNNWRHGNLRLWRAAARSRCGARNTRVHPKQRRA